jgi:hypothetical protein
MATSADRDRNSHNGSSTLRTAGVIQLTSNTYVLVDSAQYALVCGSFDVPCRVAVGEAPSNR